MEFLLCVLLVVFIFEYVNGFHYAAGAATLICVDPAMDEPSATSASTRPGGAGGQFAATHWSMVLRAGQPDAPGAAAALETLCRAYWYPVYAWIRGRGHGPDVAQDLTQEFFAGLLRKEALSLVAPEKGKFRTWLIRCIHNFLTDYHRIQTAEKRGGGQRLIEWDGLDPEQRYALEPAGSDTPDAAFDRRWSRVLLVRAYQRLEEEQQWLGRVAEFALLQEFIAAPPAEGDYERIAQQLGATQNNLAVTIRRLRGRCRELVMEGTARCSGRNVTTARRTAMTSLRQLRWMPTAMLW